MLHIQVDPSCEPMDFYTSPSGITLPAATTLHEFNAGMISALTINGINYLTGGSGKQFVSLDASWENNFRPGFFPGSGTQDGFQIQGRFEWGDRSFSVQFVVRVQSGSRPSRAGEGCARLAGAVRGHPAHG